MFLNFWHFLFVWFTSVHPKKKNRQTCVRKSLICAFAMAFIISVMLIAANQMLRNGMEWPLALWAGGGGGRTAMTSPFPIFAANAGPTTTQTLLETISLVCVLWPCFIFFCSFLNYLYSISIFIYFVSNYLVDGDGQCEKKEGICLFWTGKGRWRKRKCCFYIQVVNKWQDLCFQDHLLDLIF